MPPVADIIDFALRKKAEDTKQALLDLVRQVYRFLPFVPDETGRGSTEFKLPLELEAVRLETIVNTASELTAPEKLFNYLAGNSEIRSSIALIQGINSMGRLADSAEAVRTDVLKACEAATDALEGKTFHRVPVPALRTAAEIKATTETMYGTIHSRVETVLNALSAMERDSMLSTRIRMLRYENRSLMALERGIQMIDWNQTSGVWGEKTSWAVESRIDGLIQDAAAHTVSIISGIKEHLETRFILADRDSMIGACVAAIDAIEQIPGYKKLQDRHAF